MAERRVALHRRDVEVLELLADRQVETLDELHRRYWPSNVRKTARNRLNVLARAGYLEHVVRTDDVAAAGRAAGRPAGQHLYLLGPKAATALRRRGRGDALP